MSDPPDRPSDLPRRPAARLIVRNAAGRVLLFRFVFTRSALAGQDYWATPGGRLDEGETFEQGAIRELHEETGLRLDAVGLEVARREFVLMLMGGERVLAEERYFLVEVDDLTVSDALWSELEREVMVEYRWWSVEELAATEATVFPEDLAEMLKGIGR